MPHAGILAANPDGASVCFLTYCREGAQLLGSHTYPDVTLDYIGFGHSLAAWQTGDFASVRANFARSVDRLASAGADFFVCPDNTAHLVLGQPGLELALPGLHVARSVSDAASAAGYSRVGLLGTRFTMAGDLYPSWLQTRGIATEIPSGDDQESVDRVIFDELVDGVVTQRSRSLLSEIVVRLGHRGCDSVALVSTEISTLITAESCTLPVLESTELVARETLRVALGDQPLPTWRGGPLTPGSKAAAGMSLSARCWSRSVRRVRG